MVHTIKQLIKRILKLLPLRNIILFESCPDYADNTRPVFDEMLMRGINRKHKMIWLCYDSVKPNIPIQKNVKPIDARKRITTLFYAYTAKTIVCCNRFPSGSQEDQTSFYLMHGSPIKDISSYYTVPDNIDYVLTAGEYMNSKCAQYFKADINKCIPLGYPRNDILINAHIDLSQYFGNYSKYIIWYPTVKQQKNGKDYGIKPIPFMDNPDTIAALNAKAQALDTLIIIKPHFAQIKNYQEYHLSNIRFIHDDFYRQNNLISYEFLGSCDALLTDYSSVFYDYMICDKPIGLIWNDVEDMKHNLGLVDFYQEVTDCCSRIYNIDDFKKFLEEVFGNIDNFHKKREEICALVNAPRDGLNTARVTDFIIEKANL